MAQGAGGGALAVVRETRRLRDPWGDGPKPPQINQK